MPRPQKIALLAVICLSFVAIGATIARLIETVRVYGGSTDITWDAYLIIIWSSVDVCASLFCASAFAINPAIRKIFPQFLLPSHGSSRGSGSVHKKSYGTITSSSYAIKPSTSMGNRHALPWESPNDVELDVNALFGAHRNPTSSRIWAGRPEWKEDRFAYFHRRSSTSHDTSPEEPLDLSRLARGECFGHSIRKTISLDMAESNGIYSLPARSAT